ncbi:PQQ-dependent sugar dehydrogenase [Nonomuraea indica]|uniref:PQQ-dependent sugar dehydrogenase n=1 Tax=Nonomuraea indica TaxID=1581193 RepID=A0ABW8AA47_9ACTN
MPFSPRVPGVRRGRALAATEPRSDAGGEPAVTGTVATDLRVPWGVAVLPGGEALVSERDTARIVSVVSGRTVREVGVVPGVNVVGQGGLMSLAAEILKVKP